MKTEVMHIRCSEAILSKAKTVAKYHKKTTSRFLLDAFSLFLDGSDYGVFEVISKTAEAVGRTPAEILYEAVLEKAAKHNVKI